MARNSVCKTAILFVFGGLVYFGLEVLFRGHSHWTMFVLGGFLFLILGELNEGLLEWDTPLIWQGVLGSAIVTGAELVTGMILNVWLGLGVWDYSGMPFNYKGQICLPFSICGFSCLSRPLSSMTGCDTGCLGRSIRTTHCSGAARAAERSHQ